MTTFYGSQAAVEAVREFLEDGTASANTMNQELAALRTDQSITTAELPDVAAYERFYPREFQSREYPHISIVYESDGGEVEGRNSRMVDYKIELRLTVLDHQVAGAEVEMGQAMCRYRDALTKLFFRRVGGEGWTLNNGGSGDASGRVILAKIDSNVLTFDPELMANTANMLLRTSLTVRLEEDY
jgi:hypothetical protein